jgi:hypothetical protein
VLAQELRLASLEQELLVFGPVPKMKVVAITVLVLELLALVEQEAAADLV